MKYLIRIIIFSLCLSGALLLTLPISFFPSFYDVRYMGFAALFGAGVIYFVPRLLRVNNQNPNASTKNQAVQMLQGLLVFIITLNALGDLGLYQLYRIGFEFDKIIHFLIPFSCVLILPIFFKRRFEIRSLSAIFIAFSLSLFLGIGWELFEYLSDSLLKTHIYGVYGSDIRRDTIRDLVFGIIGSSVAGLISLFLPHWKKKFLN